jgi:integrase/recombinase XerD
VNDRARYPSGKGEVCKTFIRRFDSDPRLHRFTSTFPKSFTDATKAARVRALIQTMRWSGLAIRDVVTLRRDEIIRDKSGLYSIVTSRQKTGTHVSVPIPPDVAQEVITVLNGNPVYVFWTGNGKEVTATTNWQHDIRTLFRDAGIKAAGNMLSHRRGTRLR